MSVIAVVGYKFSKDELFSYLKCNSVQDFDEAMDNIAEKKYEYFATDEDYTEVIFGPWLIASDSNYLRPTCLENLYHWYKNTKHSMMEQSSSNYIPFSYYTACEPQFYLLSWEN